MRALSVAPVKIKKGSNVMPDTSSGLVGLIIAVFIFSLFTVLFFVVRKISRKKLAKKQILVQMLEQEFNLIEQDPKSIFPDLRGELDGVKIEVDVCMQSYSRSVAVQGERPWTRVRAQLCSQPNILVLPSGQKYSNKIKGSTEWIQQETGNLFFDQKYIFFLKEGSTLKNALPLSMSKALIEANPPVAVVGNIVLWMKLKTNHSPELIKSAVYSCKSVALAISLSNE